MPLFILVRICFICLHVILNLQLIKNVKLYCPKNGKNKKFLIAVTNFEFLKILAFFFFFYIQILALKNIKNLNLNAEKELT